MTEVMHQHSSRTPADDDARTWAVEVEGVSHRYGATQALDGVSLRLPAAKTIGFVGPDGVGKSTLLSLIAGVKVVQSGTITVLGGDIADRRTREQLLNRVAFMPQGLGHNLYPTLSILENIDFHARLFSIKGEAKQRRIQRLLEATDLYRFKERAAGKLSGGMKQKLSLCCALVHDPDLLILDEPTTGVDPLSRQQFWTLVASLRQENPQMTVIVSTAYIDEAAQFAYFVAMDDGKVRAYEPTSEVIAQGASSLDGHSAAEADALSANEQAQALEHAYNQILPEGKRGDANFHIPPFEPQDDAPPAISADGLTKRFGDFTAVDNVSFTIEKGEIFGFLGSNGCGKSTTMKMLTGLLEATEGEGKLLGEPIDAGSLDTRKKIGYMSQAFSLYEELSVRRNLELHADLYHIAQAEREQRIAQSLEEYDLSAVADTLPKNMSLGMRQRLQLAAATLHQPEVLILDEPTSGVDPAARDMFWHKLLKLSREQAITVFVSTHFMSEAARCDRISFMHQGRVLAMDTPEKLRQNQHAETLEEAFIAYLHEAIDAHSAAQSAESSAPADTSVGFAQGEQAGAEDGAIKRGGVWSWLTLVFAFAHRESKELLRDRIRLFFAIAGPIILMMSAALAVSFDVNNITMAVLDYDQSAESRELIRHFEGSPYFDDISYIKRVEHIDTVLKRNQARLVVEIPAHFGSDLLGHRQPKIAFYIDGSVPFLSENIHGYLLGILREYGMDKLKRTGLPIDVRAPVTLEPRFMYNQEFKSIYAVAPGTIMLALVIIPAMMTALGVVREKELGSITNLYGSPASTMQFLMGKQLPYIVISFVSFLCLVWLAIVLLGVPLRGSFLAMSIGTLLLLFASTGFGLLISTTVQSQVAALFATAVFSLIPTMNFSGLLYPLSSLSGVNYAIGVGFPASWYQQIMVGTFTKGLTTVDVLKPYVFLVLFALIYVVIASVLLKKQER